jgi:hypothetical protein
MAFDVQGFQQPNYQVNPVAGNKYAPQDGMTQLGNLLDYQTKNLALQKQQALQQAQIEQGLAESQSAQSQAKTAATQAQASEFKLKGDKFASALDVIGARATDPRIIELSRLATQGGPEGLKAQDELHRLNGQDFKTLKQKGLTDEEALYQLGHISSLIHERPNELPSTYENIVRQSASAANKLALQTPGLTTNAAGEIVAANPVTNKLQTLGSQNANPNPTSGGATTTTDYIKNLNQRYGSALETDMRLGEAEQLLKGIKGGAGTQNFAQLAKVAQALNFSPDIVNSIAGGDLSKVQSAQKFITQAVIQSATANPGTAESINRYIKDNPDVNTDQKALQKFIDFTHTLNNKTFDENKFLLDQKTSGKFNPETHVQQAQEYLREKYGSKNASETQGGQSKKIVKEGTYNGRRVVQYEDGTLGYK